MKILRDVLTPLALAIPLIANTVSVVASTAHEFAFYLAVVLACCEIIMAVRRVYFARGEKSKTCERIPRCLMLAAIGAALFFLGALASWQIARDSGYLLFTIAHVLKGALEIKKNM